MADLAAQSFRKLERNAGKDSTLVDAKPSYSLRGEITLDKAQTAHDIVLVDSYGQTLKEVAFVSLTPLNTPATIGIGTNLGPYFATGLPVVAGKLVATTPDISGLAANPAFAIQVIGYIE